MGSVPITLNGAGFGGGGALRNVQDSNSLAGKISLGEQQSDQFGRRDVDPWWSYPGAIMR